MLMLEKWRQRIIEHYVPREIGGEGVKAGVEYLRSAASLEAGDDLVCESPVFILSAGWRSGSTLLQRLICSDSRTLMWGEPFGDRVPVCRLAATVGGFHREDAHLKYSIDHYSGDLSKQWVANLNPGIHALRQAHLAYFETLFAKPAQAHGATRWGVKWVRLTADHAGYLKWLYPNSRILLLVRHPLHAYLSYKRKRWYTVRPRHQMRGVTRFMAHWMNLANSFVDEKDAVGGMLVRYEDLRSDSSVIDDLEQFLNIRIQQETFGERIGQRDKRTLRISLWDRAVCRLLTGPAADLLGYTRGGDVQPLAVVARQGVTETSRLKFAQTRISKDALG